MNSPLLCIKKKGVLLVNHKGELCEQIDYNKRTINVKVDGFVIDEKQGAMPFQFTVHGMWRFDFVQQPIKISKFQKIKLWLKSLLTPKI